MFIVFAVACAVATIIETIANTDTSWAYVYNTTWFGAIMVILGINLAYNIHKYNLSKIQKLPAFIFHLSFLFILLGAILTRFFGFEGIIHIREGQASNIVSSRPVYLQLISDQNGEKVSTDVNQYISTEGKNQFEISLNVDNKDAVLKYKNFVLNGVPSWKEGVNGSPRAELIFSDGKNKRNVVFEKVDQAQIGDFSFTFNDTPKQKNFIQINLKNDKFYINTNLDLNFTKMSDMSVLTLPKNQDVEFDTLGFYTYDGLNFSAISLLKSAVKSVKAMSEKNSGNNAIIADLTYNNETKEVFMFFGENGQNFKVGGKNFIVAWAPKMFELPFSLRLKDFKLDRYPGSNSPSGYSSEIEVLDSNSGNFDYEIYMNHVLDHAGYRFFQSSYDMDELGTILSVNKDPGKFPTYFGYFLLCLGMLLNFFNPNSRFLKLSRLIDESTKRDKISKGGKTLAILAVLFLSLFNAPKISAANLPHIDENHAKNLGSLIVQGFDGRMEPFDTMSRELLNKIYRSDKYENMSHNAVMISLMLNSDYWQNAEFIKVSDKELKKILGIDIKQSHAKFGDFFGVDESNKSYYKLGKMAEEINRKPLGNRTTLDKEILKVDERLNIFYMTYMGEIFKILPKQNAENNEWFSPMEAMMNFQKDEAERASKVLQDYFSALINAQSTANWAEADRALEKLKEYQKTYGAAVIPNENVVKFEILYNNIQIFKRLMPLYILAGFALLVCVFIRMMNPKLRINFAFKFVYGINILAFVLHTLGLILRWYISGHAPWSNSYESLVYIAWALSLSGIIFSKTSALSLALTSILAGITLFVAHLSMIDPQVTNIQPVLKSYWLTIHVSVITASYGFFGLCWLLGIFTLLLFIFQKNQNAEISRNIVEATRINEMSMILGLCLLTVGNFLGGVWANESWGRYWGWDPKETWALITILIYAAVVHFRFIPRLNNQFAFAVASVLAFASVIMTYFGVNFYLSGMHSYANGEKVPVPTSLWVISLTLFILIILAFFKRKTATKL